MKRIFSKNGQEKIFKSVVSIFGIMFLIGSFWNITLSLLAIPCVLVVSHFK